MSDFNTLDLKLDKITKVVTQTDQRLDSHIKEIEKHYPTMADLSNAITAHAGGCKGNKPSIPPRFNGNVKIGLTVGTILAVVAGFALTLIEFLH